MNLSPEITFNIFIENELDEDRTLSSDTKRGHKNTLNKLNDFNQHINFDALNFDIIDRFNNYLNGLGLSQNSIHGHHKRIKRYLRRAIAKKLFPGDISMDPYFNFKSKTTASDRRPLYTHHIQALLDLNVKKNNSLQFIKDLFLFSVGTGIRFGDVMNLNVRNIEKTTKGMIIRFTMDKVNKPLSLPIYLLPYHDSTKDIIKRYLKGKEPEETIFRRISNQKVNAQLKSLGILIDYEGLHFHQARHTFGTLIAQATGNIFKVMRYLGHSKPETSLQYVKLANEMYPDEL